MSGWNVCKQKVSWNAGKLEVSQRSARDREMEPSEQLGRYSWVWGMDHWHANTLDAPK